MFVAIWCYLDVIQVSFAHVFVAEREIGTPSVVLVDGGRAQHPVAAGRRPRCRTGCARVQQDGTAVTGTAHAAAAASATSSASRNAVVCVVPRRTGRFRTHGSVPTQTEVSINIGNIQFRQRADAYLGPNGDDGFDDPLGIDGECWIGFCCWPWSGVATVLAAVVAADGLAGRDVC